MLSVRAAGNSIESSSTESRRYGDKYNTHTGSCKVAVMRRTSTIRTESTLIESGDNDTINMPVNAAHHQQDLSLITDFDLNRATKQLKNGEISDLELALFAFWIKASDSNYVRAKALVRELALDQVGCAALPAVAFITNYCRVTTSVKSPINVYASFFRKYTTSVQGLCTHYISLVRITSTLWLASWRTRHLNKSRTFDTKKVQSAALASLQRQILIR